MTIKDLQSGRTHEYGTNPHDSLMVSEDGRSLTYYNLQNGDGSQFGDYRFVTDDLENFWNIGGMPKIEPRKKGKWKRKITDGGFSADWVCSACGFKWGMDFIGFNFCPYCGSDNRGEERE